MELDVNDLIATFPETLPDFPPSVPVIEVGGSSTVTKKVPKSRVSDLKPEKPEKAHIIGVTEKALYGDEVVNKGGNSRLNRHATKKGKPDMELTEFVMSDGSRVIKPKTVWDLGHLIDSPLLVYQVVQARLQQEGFRVEYDPYGGGLYSNHRVFRVGEPSGLPGVNYPKGFKVLLPITPSELSPFLTALKKVIKGLLETACDFKSKATDTTSKPSQKLESGETLEMDEAPEDFEFGHGSGSKGSPEDKYRMYLHAQIKMVWRNFELFNPLASQCGVIMANEKQAFHSPISVDGTGVANRYIPQVSWFDPKLSEIDNEQLLGIIPGPEREAFMLQLGRSLYGRQGTPFTNGRHQGLKWRALTLFEGREAGMGRSTLLDLLTTGFKSIGYHCGPMQDLTGKFGHGRGATTDFGFQDDLSPEKTITSLCSDILKSMSSGGTFTAEEKGQQSRQVTAMGTYLLCTNRFDLTKLHQLDPGNLSRLMPMRNVSSTDARAKEYRKKYGYNINTDQTYEALAKQYGVPQETLVLLLLARSAEMFREYVDSGDQAGLIQHLQDLKSQFLIQTNLTYVDDLMGHYIQLYACGNSGKAPEVFSVRNLIEVLKVGAEHGLQIPSLSDSPKMVLEYVTQAWGGGKKGQPALALSFFSCLNSDSGMSYPTNTADLSQRFHQIRESVDTSHIRSALLKEFNGDSLDSDDVRWVSLKTPIQRTI